jgi:hypothetical protein
MTPHPVNVMLVLYWRRYVKTPYEASTVEEHYGAFRRHSQFVTWEWNVELGYPEALDEIDPAAVVLHYSLFGSGVHLLDDDLRAFLDRTRARKIAFFQDEMSWMQKRFRFVDQYRIDTVYTHIDEDHWDETWRRYTSVPEIVHNFPGYVSDYMVAGAQRFARSSEKRDIDVGYRGRPLPSWLGQAAQEKTIIGEEFKRRAAGAGLRLDIRTGEDDRLYADDWHRFLGRCRAVLGVESGVSYLDLEDEVLKDYSRLRDQRGAPPTLDELTAGALGRWDNNIPYRTISPRHLEAAAFRVCQVLFTGAYAGVLRPMIHYIPLEKDFSNFDQVIAQLRDDNVQRTIAENAHRDLVASGRYSYSAFVASFDARLIAHGLDPTCSQADRRTLDRALQRMRMRRWIRKRFALVVEGPSGARRRAERIYQQRAWYTYRVVAPLSRLLRRALRIQQKESR